jgi:hypothetical protein
VGERMTREQAVLLSRAIVAGWPHQKLDDATVDVWAQGLRFVDPPLRYADCEEAIYRLVTKAPFTGPEAVVTEVRRIRASRIDGEGDVKVIPNVDPDDGAAYRREILAIRAAIADKTFDADRYAASGVALTGGRQLKAIGDGRKPRELEGRVSLHPDRLSGLVRSPERPSAADYGTSPIQIRRSVGRGDADRMEAERARQLVALESMAAES